MSSKEDKKLHANLMATLNGAKYTKEYLESCMVIYHPRETVYRRPIKIIEWMKKLGHWLRSYIS